MKATTKRKKEKKKKKKNFAKEFQVGTKYGNGQLDRGVTDSGQKPFCPLAGKEYPTVLTVARIVFVLQQKKKRERKKKFFQAENKKINKMNFKQTSSAFSIAHAFCSRKKKEEEEEEKKKGQKKERSFYLFVVMKKTR